MSTQYIIFYNSNEQALCSSNVLSLSNNSNDITYHIFDTKYYLADTIKKYESFFDKYSITNKFLSYDFKKEMKTIVKDIQKYERFVIFSSSLFVKNNIFASPKNKVMYYISREKDAVVGVYNRTGIVDLIRDKKTIDSFQYDLLSIKNKKDFSDYQVVITDSVLCSSSTTPDSSNDSIIYYENNNCCFSILPARPNGIRKSPVYFNKNNNKIYNIDNNVFGNVIEYNEKVLIVEWKINDSVYTCEYTKKHNVFI